MEVALATTDGVELVAWYTPSRNGAAVIVLPGSGGAKGSTVEHAAVLARHGYRRGIGTVASTASSHVAVLLIGCDAADEIGAAPLLQAASGSLTRWDVPDAPHIGALATHPPEWERRVVGFLEASLPET